MKIQDLILQKKLIRDGAPSLIFPQCPPFDLLRDQLLFDRKELYRDASGSLWVMLNTTAGIFRISEPGLRFFEGELGDDYDAL